jgi:septal ring factor EnvC (AmiA/AmiB activator)
MAKEPDSLVLGLVRELRSDMAVVRERADEHADELRALRKEIHDWQETTATATGFAVHANTRVQSIEQDLAALKKRVEKLEEAK